MNGLEFVGFIALALLTLAAIGAIIFFVGETLEANKKVENIPEEGYVTFSNLAAGLKWRDEVASTMLARISDLEKRMKDLPAPSTSKDKK